MRIGRGRCVAALAVGAAVGLGPTATASATENPERIEILSETSDIHLGMHAYGPETLHLAVSVYTVLLDCIPGRNYGLEGVMVQDGNVIPPAEQPKGAAVGVPCTGGPMLLTRQFLSNALHPGEAVVSAQVYVKGGAGGLAASDHAVVTVPTK